MSLYVISNTHNVPIWTQILLSIANIFTFDNISKYFYEIFIFFLANMTINERISLLIKLLDLNNNSFAKALDVNPTVTFNVISGRNTKPSYDLLEKIVFTFDNINTEWLLKGRGEVFTSGVKTTTTISTTGTKKTVSPQNENTAEITKILKTQLEEMTKMNRDLTTIVLNLSNRQ